MSTHHMQPEPEGSQDDTSEAWVRVNLSVELLSPVGEFIALPVSALRIVAIMGGGTLVVDDVKVTVAGGEEALDVDSHGTFVRLVLS